MQTSLALARAQLRHGWRSLAGIVVLVALIGGLVLAGFAGAQRTRTAVDRMIEQPVVPLAGPAALILVVLVLAAFSGLGPIRLGLRHQPATVLHSE